MTTNNPSLSRRSTLIASSEIRDLLRLAQRPGVISLAGGLPDPAAFPIEAIAAAATHAISSDPATALQYGPTEGDDRLRAWVADRHTRQTGRATAIDQVVVTTGSQQALALIARVLADAGDVAMVEDPGYLGALQAFRGDGLALAGVKVDHEGLDSDHLESLLASGVQPRFVYTVPSFQNPTGSTMSPDRRAHLAGLSDLHGFVIIEDAPYAELCFDAAPPPPVASLTDRVVSVGTLSKVLAPGLRVGWVIAAPDVAAAIVRAKQASDLHTSSLSQAIAVELTSQQEWLDDQVAAIARRYRDRAETLHVALVDRFGERLRCTAPRGGMFLWATVHGIDSRALLATAIDQGVAFVPGSAFSVERDLANALRLSFATATTTELVEAVERLGEALDRLDPARVDLRG
jgi:2-aminoadipate transaminase